MRAYRIGWHVVNGAVCLLALVGTALAVQPVLFLAIGATLAMLGALLGVAFQEELKDVRHPVLTGAALATTPALLPGLTEVLGGATLAVTAVLVLTSPWVVGQAVRRLQPWLQPARIVQAGMAEPDEALRRQWVESTRLLGEATTSLAERMVVVQARQQILDDLAARNGGRLPASCGTMPEARGGLATRSASRTVRADPRTSGTFGPTRDGGAHRPWGPRRPVVGRRRGRRRARVDGRGGTVATAIEVRQAHQDMLETRRAWSTRSGTLPAGVVLRSYWRAVRPMRHAGCPVPARADEAELLARELLGARGVRVPQPAALRWRDRRAPAAPRGRAGPCLAAASWPAAVAAAPGPAPAADAGRGAGDDPDPRRHPGRAPPRRRPDRARVRRRAARQPPVRYVDRLVADGSGLPVRDRRSRDPAGGARARRRPTTRRGAHGPATHGVRAAQRDDHRPGGRLRGGDDVRLRAGEAHALPGFTLQDPSRLVIDVRAGFRTVQRPVFFLDRDRFVDDVEPFFVPRMRPVRPGTPATGLMDRLFAGPLPAERAPACGW